MMPRKRVLLAQRECCPAGGRGEKGRAWRRQRSRRRVPPALVVLLPIPVQSRLPPPRPSPGAGKRMPVAGGRGGGASSLMCSALSRGAPLGGVQFFFLFFGCRSRWATVWARQPGADVGRGRLCLTVARASFEALPPHPRPVPEDRVVSPAPSCCGPRSPFLGLKPGTRAFAGGICFRGGGRPRWPAPPACGHPNATGKNAPGPREREMARARRRRLALPQLSWPVRTEPPWPGGLGCERGPRFVFFRS